MQISIINEQRRAPLNINLISSYADKALRILKVKEGSSLSITFVSSRKIKLFNKRYFNKDRATDVIALGYGRDKKASYYRDYLGDILICPERAALNSRTYANSLRHEIALYVVHGILHLLGYKDITETGRLLMQKKEKYILKKLKL